MRHLRAMQSAEDKRWYFAALDGEVVELVGNCREHQGHETAQEAVDCYKEYLLEQDFHVFNDHPDKQCEVCGFWTTLRVRVGETVAVMCSKHVTPDAMRELLQFTELYEP